MKVNITVFVASPHGRAVGIQCPGTESTYIIHIHHVGEVRVIPNRDLLQLMRGSITVKKIQERHPALYSGQVRHGDRSMIS